METLHREVTALQEWTELQLDSARTINDARHAAQRREDEIREAHRRELKADNQRTVETAMVAAEKAVQAALAAAEKARDQQTIASQLATEKAEKASKEQLQQQGETFSTAIASINGGLSDVKGTVSGLLAERKGSSDTNTRTLTIVGILAAILGTVLGRMT